MIHWKSPWCWERLRVEGEGGIRGWDGWTAYQCNEHELGQTLGCGEGLGDLQCCSPWGCKELDMTGWLNNNKKQRKQTVYKMKTYFIIKFVDGSLQHPCNWSRAPVPVGTSRKVKKKWTEAQGIFLNHVTWYQVPKLGSNLLVQCLSNYTLLIC